MVTPKKNTVSRATSVAVGIGKQIIEWEKSLQLQLQTEYELTSLQRRYISVVVRAGVVMIVNLGPALGYLDLVAEGEDDGAEQAHLTGLKGLQVLRSLLEQITKIEEQIGIIDPTEREDDSDV